MKNDRNRLSSILFLCVIVAWPILTVFTIPAGDTASQLQHIAQNLSAHVVNFGVALLIGPSVVWLLVSYRDRLSSERDGRFRSGVICYAVYLVLITISYGSQIVILPRLLARENMYRAAEWLFYNDSSIPILINQSGYLFWSLGTVLLFAEEIRMKDRLTRITVGILLLSSAMQITASIGLYFRKTALTGLSFPSGLLLVPAGILILIQSYRSSRVNTESGE